MTATPPNPPPPALSEPALETTGGGRVGALGVGGLFLAFTLAGIVLLAGFNVGMNPRAEFPFALTETLVSNDVPIKVRHFEKLDGAPDVLIVGSSRVMTIGSAQTEAVGLGRAFNFGLSSAMPGDMLAAFRYVESTGKGPDLLIAGVEADQFHAARQMRYETRLSAELGPHTEEPVGPSTWMRAAAKSLSRDYLADSFEVLRYTIGGYPPRALTFEPDGLRHVADREDAHADPSFDVREVIRTDAPRHLPTYSTLGEPAPHHLAKLHALVHEARAAGVEVHLFLTPMHPDMLAAVEGTPFRAAHAALVDDLASLCGPGVHVHEFLLLDSWEADPNEFDDGVHYTQANAHALVRAMKEGKADLCGAR